MKYYKIKDLSEMTSLTVRALQYYDEIGLLKPNQRTASGYRLYCEDDVLRLQQISTLKFLGFSLENIKKIIDTPHFNVMQSLQIQAQGLSEKAQKIQEASRLLKHIAAQIDAKQAINWHSMNKIITILEGNTMNENALKQYQAHENHSELGKETSYDTQYNPDRLYSISRAGKRKELGIDPESPPFFGFDCWNHYEVSWLNEKGKPMVAMAEIMYDCHSPCIVESKSLKLYFNSLNNTKFSSLAMVEATIKKDLTDHLQAEPTVAIRTLGSSNLLQQQNHFTGECIDHLDITCSIYTVEPKFLSTHDEYAEETLYSDLLKSNCLVTHQPDWGSVQIIYKGNKIQREGLLRYIVSYRNHNEFHEQCIERIFVDIMHHCRPKELTVYGRYTRRGGLDINPYRSTNKVDLTACNLRLPRQ